MRVVLVTLAACVATIGAYLALGGGSYQPTPVADPCEPRPLTAAEGTDEVLQAVALSALDGAACELRVTREDLLAALADPGVRSGFLDERRISDQRLEAAIRAGLERSYDDAVSAGRIAGIEAFLLRQAIDRAPIALIVDIAQSETARDAAGLLRDLLG
jgi:hypothetical protein